MYEKSNKTHLIAILKVLLDIDDIQVMKYTIESLVEELEDSGGENTTNDIGEMNDFKGDL